LNRDALRQAGVLTVSVVGGPGCGKTTLVAETVERLMPDVHVGVIACDVGSHRDADRIRCVSEQVVQVNTCEARGVIEASHIRDALNWLDLNWLDLLLIEHVGTLTLADAPDVGQDASVTMFSVAAGDDKADKHPELVRAADVVLLNKVDLLPSVPFDLAAFRRDVERIKPGCEVIELSAVKASGLERWVEWLRSRVAHGSPSASSAASAKVSHWFG
jgi:hydrogenase nickel incorporation protein HypB